MRLRTCSVFRAAGALLLVGLSLAWPPACHAGLLNLEPDPNGPALLTFPGSVNFTKASGNFNATADALSLSGGGVPGGFAIFSWGTATVDLFVDGDGTLVSSGGGFSLVGGIDLDGDAIDDATGALLFGAVTAFGADLPGPPTRLFNGLFAIQGGALTGPVALSGGGFATVGFKLGEQGGFLIAAEDVVAGTLADFGGDFASSSGKVEAFALVPEPATATLGVVAAAALGLWASRRRKARPAA